MIRPPDMPYDVYKAVRSDLNKAMKERKRGTVVWESRDKKTGKGKTAKKYTKK
jgi:hypothetical protein